MKKSDFLFLIFYLLYENSLQLVAFVLPCLQDLIKKHYVLSKYRDPSVVVLFQCSGLWKSKSKLGTQSGDLLYLGMFGSIFVSCLAFIIVPDSVGGYSLFVIVPDSVGGYSLFCFICLSVCLSVCLSHLFLSHALTQKLLLWSVT